MRLTATLVFYSKHTKRTFKQDSLQVSYSIRHAQKTHMSSAIDYKFRVLFGTHTKCSSYNMLRLTSSLVLYSARTKTHKTHKSSKIDYNTHRNAYVKQDCLKFPTIFGTHRKRIFQVRLNTSLAPYSSLTETHMSSNVIKPNYFATPPVDTLPQIV